MTKYYCCVECSKADEAVHAVCCKNSSQVNKWKVKKGGEARKEIANQNLEIFKRNSQAMYERRDQAKVHFTEVMSKFKEIKLKGDQKKEQPQYPEVD